MLSAFKGRGLFVFSDPGGAKPVLALVSALQFQLDAYLIISDREYAFYKDFNVVVKAAIDSPFYTIDSFEPDFVFTGTSYTSKLELTYIAAAKALNICTYAYIDHWTSMRKRFDNEGIEILPDFICVIDEKAQSLALKEGIEAEKIKIFGNPYHQFLEHWQPTLSKSVFFKTLGIERFDKKIALYAPDPLSNVDGITVFGFDEIIATNALSRIADELSDNYQFILKPHPNQNLDTIRESVNDSFIIVDKNADANTLIYYADCVIGFFSNFLIEACVMQKKVFRFAVVDNMVYPDRIGKADPFQDKAIGTVVNEKELLKCLKGA